MIRRRTSKDERGATLVMAAVGLVVAVIMAGLAVDIGFVAQEARDNQKVADLAALDAVRALPADPTQAAVDSALRNGFTTTMPPYFEVETGTMSGGVFTPTALAAASAVRVKVMSVHDNRLPFNADGQKVTRLAVASMDDKAQFSVGSNLATLNPTDNVALNRIMTALLGTSSTMNLSVVGYQGLAGGTVSLSDLVAADPSLGSPDSLLSTPISVRRLAQVTLTALNNKAAGGDTAALAAATPLATFASNIDTNLMVRLADIVSIQQPLDPAAAGADAQLNVFDLITAGGQAGVASAVRVANGTNFVSVSGLTVSVAGLGATTLKLTVIEPPKISAFGPARFDSVTNTWATTAHTAQVAVELNTRITVGNCGGLLPTCVDWRLPLEVSAAKATGSLTDVRCSNGSTTKEADILAETVGANATSDNTLTVKLLGLNLLPPLSVVSTNVDLAGSSPPHETLSFSGPPFPTPIQTTAAPGAGLTTATQSKLTLLGILPVGAVLDLVSPVTEAVDNEILEPLFNALGLSIAGADVRTLRVECGVPALMG